MSNAIVMFLVCVILIVLPMMSSIAKKKRFEASMKRYLDERMNAECVNTQLQKYS